MVPVVQSDTDLWSIKFVVKQLGVGILYLIVNTQKGLKGRGCHLSLPPGR